MKLELEHLKLPNQAITDNQKPIEKETQSTSLQQQTHTGISLAELSERYLQTKTEAGYPEKTIKGYQDSHQLMLEILGNRVVDSLTHQDGRKLVETIKKLPANRSKCHPKLTLQQLLLLEDAKLLSYKTILKHVERISSLINSAINQGYTNQNVFRGKLEPIRSQQIIEKHFTSDEMNLILGDRLISDSRAINKPERYWITLLSAYSGAKLNEICQLNVDNISKTDGIWPTNSNGDSADKSTNTKSGNRVIPLHPKLLSLGFLNYLHQIKIKKNYFHN